MIRAFRYSKWSSRESDQDRAISCPVGQKKTRLARDFHMISGKLDSDCQAAPSWRAQHTAAGFDVHQKSHLDRRGNQTFMMPVVLSDRLARCHFP